MDHQKHDNHAGQPPRTPEPILARLFDPIGHRVTRVVNNLGAATIFLARALLLIFGRKQFWSIVQHINIIGARTVNIEDPSVRYVEGFAEVAPADLVLYLGRVTGLVDLVDGASNGIAPR